MTRRQWGGAMAALTANALMAQSKDGTGPAVGEKIPELSAVDQLGKRRAFDDLTGPNGLLLLFHRSADW